MYSGIYSWQILIIVENRNLETMETKCIGNFTITKVFKWFFIYAEIFRISRNISLWGLKCLNLTIWFLFLSFNLNKFKFCSLSFLNWKIQTFYFIGIIVTFEFIEKFWIDVWMIDKMYLILFSFLHVYSDSMRFHNM